MSEDLLKARITALLENQGLQQVEDYLKLGRQFRDLASGNLRELWLAAFKRYAEDLNQSDRLISEDAGAELTLRGEAIPFGEANDALELIQRKALASMEGISKGELRRLGEGILDDLADFERDATKRQS